MRKYEVILACSCFLAVHTAFAGDALQERFSASLRGILPDVEVTQVRPSPLTGIYEVSLGPKILYMSEDGRFVFSGDLMDLQERRNLSEERRSEARLEAFARSGTDRMIEFGPKNPKHVMYVYTDVDCTYCRRFHQEIGVLNKAGIAVRYLAYPRAGIGSDSYKKAVSVWCAKDQQQALTDAKAGKKIKSANCDNPVAEHFAMGQAMGVRGTPTIILDNGEELGGYVPAKELIKLLAGGGA